MKISRIALVLASAFFSAELPGQEILWERIGVKDKELIGATLEVAGDVNSDGYEDLLMVAASWSGGTNTQVRILSGKDGSTLLTYKPAASYLLPNWAEGVGDMDGDATPDFAVQIYDTSHRNLPTRVEVHSGKTGKLIWSVQEPHGTSFGSSFIGDLDLDGDGKPDLVVAAYRLRHPKYSYLFVGGVWAFNNKGKLLYRFTGNLNGGLQVGMSLAKVGDVDKDGKDDFVVGTNGHVPSGYGGAMLVSGATGKTLFHAVDKKMTYMIGREVSEAGDMDRDGTPDFIMTGNFGVSTMYVFSGKTGKILLKHDKKGQTDGISGRGLDFDKDGIPDIVRNALGYRPPGSYFGSVLVLSGRDGQILTQADNKWRTGISGDFGFYVVALASPKPTGIPLFAMVQPTFGSSRVTGARGRIAVFRGLPSGVRDFGSPCKGPATSKTAPAIGLKRAGAQSTRIQLAGAKPGSIAFLFLGLSKTRLGPLPLPLKLDSFGFTRCSLFTSSEVIIPTSTGKSGLTAGHAAIDIPLALAFPGKTSLHGQWAYMGPGVGVWGFSGGLTWKH